MKQDTQKQKKAAKPEGLFEHFRSPGGLYSRETFLGLLGCINRMVETYPMRGFVISRVLGDSCFQTMVSAMDNHADLPVYHQEEGHTSDETGFLVILSDRLCAAVYWKADARKTSHLYRGGWSFHPADTKIIAQSLINTLDDERLQTLLEKTQVDRRYDEKSDVLIASLVESLEGRNRDLANALDLVSELNHKVLESERMAAIGQLCSVIAHEIRNPLGLIDLYAKLVETQLNQIDLTHVETKQREILGKNLSLIRSSTESLETILSELTSYARPLQLKTEATDLVQLVEDTCEFYRPSFDEKQIRLHVEPFKSGPLMLALDSGRIRQALINLVKNALEVSETGNTVTVTVTSREGDRDVYIKVQDEGSGIEEALIPKLFTPYFSTKGNGTGLGLAHSRKILQAHGGGIELLATQPGEGSTFALVIPRQGDST